MGGEFDDTYVSTQEDCAAYCDSVADCVGFDTFSRQSGQFRCSLCFEVTKTGCLETDGLTTAGNQGYHWYKTGECTTSSGTTTTVVVTTTPVQTTIQTTTTAPVETTPLATTTPAETTTLVVTETTTPVLTTTPAETTTALLTTMPSGTTTASICNGIHDPVVLILMVRPAAKAARFALG